MKKQFLLGLMAILLPLAGWALAEEETTPQLGLAVSLESDDLTDGEVEYSGKAVTVTPAVTYSYQFGNVTKTETLDGKTDYDVTYTYQDFIGGTTKTIDDPETGLVNAGTYTVKVTGKGEAYNGLSATATFTITRAKLTLTEDIKKDEATKQYGAPNSDLELSELIELSEDNGLKSNDTTDDAIGCLALNTLYSGEVVGGKVLLDVIAAEENTSVNYSYETPKVPVSVVVNITEKVLTLAWDEGKGKSTYNDSEIVVNSLVPDVKGLEDVKEGEAVGLSLDLEEGTTEIKDAGNYTIKVTLTGENAGNYTLKSDELTYTVDRATIKIGVAEGQTLEKVYDGDALTWDVLKDYFSINIGVEAFEGLGLSMMPKTEQLEGVNVDNYTIMPYFGGKMIGSGSFDAPAGLKNYKIEYTKASFKVTPKIVTYYFAGSTTPYTGQPITLSDEDYTATILDGVLEDDENDVEITNPTAKFEDDEVKNAGEYTLVLDQPGSLTGDKAKNYVFAEAPSQASENEEEAWNTFEVTPGTMTITVKPQTIAFGTEVTEELKASWAAYNNGSGNGTGTVITNTPDFGNDRSTMRNLISLSLGDKAATGASGTYNAADGDGILINLLDSDPTGKLTDDDVLALYNNYGGKGKITLNGGNLTISDVELQDGLVLNAGEDFVTEDEGTEDEGAEEEEAEDPAEPVAKVADLLKQYNGATVNKVTIRNLINYVGHYGEDGIYKYTDANQTFEAGKWYTLVLPFDVELGELSQQLGYAVFYTPNAQKTQVADDGWSDIYFSITFEKIPANTMMLFRVDGSNENIADGLTFTTKKIVALTEDETENGIEISNGINYVPVYAKKGLNKTDATEYILWTEQSQFLPVTYILSAIEGEEFNVYPFNGYVTTPSPLKGARFFVENSDGSTTAISAITGEAINNNAEGWYTVGGMKLNAQPTQKGVYINNGKKVVIK